MAIKKNTRVGRSGVQKKKKKKKVHLDMFHLVTWQEGRRTYGLWDNYLVYISCNKWSDVNIISTVSWF